ncbi:MAG TPA: hypothetical protein ENJ93_00260, partial [Chloroflexi bacterium]|nr:hypothetical protein [Chloroflexota bacterium]
MGWCHEFFATLGDYNRLGKKQIALTGKNLFISKSVVILTKSQGGNVSGKICIIGAGSAGIATAKTLKEAGLPFDCFEMGSNIGGNWRYNNDNGRSAAYDSLTIDTSKDRMQFSDFPMPEEYPNFPNHRQIAQYFDAYADHFGLR